MKKSQRQTIEDVEILLLSKNQQRNNSEFIHQSPTLGARKNIFVRSKKRILHQTHNSYLLFDRNSSMSMLKGYHNRKKILLQEQFHKKHYDITRSLHQSKTDSPQKVNLFLESVKYDFEKCPKRKQYEKTLKMIEENELFSKMEFQKERQKKENFENQPKNINHDFLLEKYLIKSLALEKKQILKLSPKKFHSSTLSPRETNQQFIRIRTIKSSNEGFFQNTMVKTTQSQGKSITNPEKQLNHKNRYDLKAFQKAVQDLKIKKQTPKPQNQLSLPQIKVIKQGGSIRSKQNLHFQKGYITFHPEMKNFIKQHRQNLNQQAKIPPLAISGITATSFCVIDISTMKPIAYRNFTKRIQIASLSKIMTCYLCLLACRKYEIDIKKYVVRVSKEASEMIGTSAELEYGDCLTLEEALYGLMLPSGNDASYAIAQTIGKIIQRHKTKQTKKTYYETFIAHMNLLSREMKLQQEWRNCSGLPLNPNHSTPQAISLLSIAALMDQKFRNIVSCKEFQATIKNEKTGLKKNITWKNTNKLLNEGWQGVKTGTTESAGHCLIAKRDRYLISVFNSSTLSKRFTECSLLYSLVKSKQRHLFLEKRDQDHNKKLFSS